METDQGLSDVAWLALMCGSIFMFGALWVGVLTALGHRSGWRRLAARFAGMVPGQAGQRFTALAGSVGPLGRSPMSFRGAIGIGVGPTGIALRPTLPFRALGAPVFVPWHHVTVTFASPRAETWIDIEVSSREVVRLALWGRSGAAVGAAAQACAGNRSTPCFEGVHA